MADGSMSAQKPVGSKLEDLEILVGPKQAIAYSELGTNPSSAKGSWRAFWPQRVLHAPQYPGRQGQHPSSPTDLRPAQPVDIPILPSHPWNPRHPR